MIKKMAYIRSFTDVQKQQLEKISAETGLKNASDVFLHCLEAYYTKQLEVERWKGIAAYKDKKVKKLNEQIASLVYIRADDTPE
ncbi:hypothetical protein ACLI1A_10315 [Flavobacterium sp. RHBU_3]|uniref:hypothetical protein n=1 Tax=Flavobacterium sp. RHBU_3 TaxID=3391184 RepID=UPI003984E4BE